MTEIPDHAPPTVSIENQMPMDLFDAMREFIQTHPQWDQYRLMQAALAGFLFQQGSQDRAVARHYLDGLFRHEARRSISETIKPLAKEMGVVSPASKEKSASHYVQQ